MKKRVLIVGNFLSSSKLGSYTVCEALAYRLQSVGWHVLTTSGKPARLSRLIDMLLSAWRWRSEYDVPQVDVYSGPSFIWAESVCRLLHRLGKPFVLTLHGGNLPAFSARWPGRVRRLLHSASAVTTPSHYLQKALSAYRDELLLLPNAIDLVRYSFRLRAQAQPQLVWLRALHRIYNPHMALDAVAALVPQFPEIRLTLFGPDKRDGSLEQLQRGIEQLQLSGRVSLAGAVSKERVPAALHQGDIFINTTNHESFGVSVMEAAACGLCIVATDVGELPLLWQHGHNALLVKRGEPEVMARAVRAILSDPRLAERLSSNGRRNAEQFDWSVVLPKWEQLLSALLPDVPFLGHARARPSSSGRSVQ